MTDRGAAIAIIGCGIVGRSWAISFARAGFAVRIHDRDEAVARNAIRQLKESLAQLEELDLLGGQDATETAQRITIAKTLEEAVGDADYVQENTPETIEVKKAIFNELDRFAPATAILASSTSALLASQFAMEISRPERCLVVHPLNPPHLIPAVELVPSPRTEKGVIRRAIDILERAGQKPILVAREIEGFLMNRLQGALLDEAFAMVADGYASPADVDTAVKDGLARRWSFMGPFETIDLNAPDGIHGFIERYGSAYASIGKSRPNRPTWDGELAARLIEARRAELPFDNLSERQQWRDRRLASLAAHLKNATDEIGD